MANEKEVTSYEAAKTKLLVTKEEIPADQINAQLNAFFVVAVEKQDGATIHRLLTERHYGISGRTCLEIKHLPQTLRINALILILPLDSFWALLPDDDYKKTERDLRYNALVSITGTINDTLGGGYTLRAMLYPETRRGIIDELKKLSP